MVYQPSQEDLNKAYAAAQRVAQGKKVSFANEPGVARAYEYIVNENPSVRKAIEQGMQLKLQAREAGFERVEEYIEAKKWAGKKEELKIKELKEEVRPSTIAQQITTD